MKDTHAGNVMGLWLAMPKWQGSRVCAVVVALAVAFACTTATTAQQAGGDAPKISVDSPAHDFGTTWIGPSLDHTFKITNKGSKTLDILKVRTSCGCVVAGKYPQTLEPGQTGEFPFSINSRKVRGRYEKTVRISSSDPVNPTLELKLRGECKRYVDLMPTAAIFEDKIFGDRKHEKVLKVINNTDDPLELQVDAPSDSKFKFNLVETKPGKEFELHVSISAEDAGVGTLRTVAKLKTNKEAQKDISVTAVAAIAERLEVVPRSIKLDRELVRGRTPKPKTEVVRFINHGDTPTKVREATVDDPEVKVVLNTVEEGKRYDVVVEMPGGWNPPAAGRTLTLKTDDKKTPEMKVKITGKGATPRTAEQPKRVSPEDLVGKPAPKFELTTTGGKKVSNETLADAITVLDFFSTRCGHCSKQIPRVEKMREKYAEKGVRFIAVGQAQAASDADAVKEKINTLGFKGELAVDTGRAVNSLFQVRGVPAMVILGKTGVVEAANIGNIRDLESKMESQLDALLAGKPLPRPTPSAARQQKPRQRPAMEMVGKQAPKFSLKTLKGTAVGTAELGRHSATVLNFVSPNCGFCKRQVPNVEKIRAEYEAKGVQFVNMSMKMGQGMNRQTGQPWTHDEIVDLFKNAGSGLDIAIDEGNAVGGMFKATSFPTMVVIGKDGKVEHVNIGAKPDIDTVLKGQLDALIAKE